MSSRNDEVVRDHDYLRMITSSRNDEIVRGYDYLRMIIDYGSGGLKCAIQHVKAGETPSQTRIYDVMLKPGQKVVEQKIICLDDGKLLWGRSAVQQYKRENPREAGHVIELWKLLLCPQYRDTLTARRLCRVIAGHDSYNDDVKVELEEFMAEHLREIKAATLRWLTFHHPMGLKYDANHWQSIPIECMITVPAMWDEEAQGSMKNAAMKAGFPDISVRYEELCAAAAEARPLLESGDIEYGWKICFVDIGRGTVDISTVQILETGITMVGKSTGALAGSQVVNDEVLKYVVECDQVRSMGGWQEACRRLDIDQDSFLEQVSTSVESRKVEFPDIDSMLIDVRPGPDWKTVTAEDGTYVGRDGLTIGIPYEDLEACFKTWADRICAAIERHLLPAEQDCHAAILTGGGSTNSYVREHCDELFYQAHWSCITRQHVCAVHDLPDGYLYMSQNENYDPKVHKDCNSRKRNRHGKRKSGPNDSKLIVWAEGATDETRLAPDRLTLLMSNIRGRTTTQMILSHWLVSVREDAVLTFDLYHSVTKLKECGPVRDRTGNVRQELTKWPILFSDLPDLSIHGFLSYTDQGKEVYRVNGYLEVNATKTHMDITLVLLKPVVGFKYDKQDNAILHHAAYSEDEIVCRKTIEVFDGRRSHIVAKDITEPKDAHDQPSLMTSKGSQLQSCWHDRSSTAKDFTDTTDCDDEEALPTSQNYKLERTGRMGTAAAEGEASRDSLYEAMTLRPRRRKVARTGT